MLLLSWKVFYMVNILELFYFSNFPLHLLGYISMTSVISDIPFLLISPTCFSCLFAMARPSNSLLNNACDEYLGFDCF